MQEFVNKLFAILFVMDGLAYSSIKFFFPRELSIKIIEMSRSHFIIRMKWLLPPDESLARREKRRE